MSQTLLKHYWVDDIEWFIEKKNYNMLWTITVQVSSVLKVTLIRMILQEI